MTALSKNCGADYTVNLTKEMKKSTSEVSDLASDRSWWHLASPAPSGAKDVTEFTTGTHNIRRRRRERLLLNLHLRLSLSRRLREQDGHLPSEPGEGGDGRLQFGAQLLHPGRLRLDRLPQRDLVFHLSGAGDHLHQRALRQGIPAQASCGPALLSGLPTTPGFLTGPCELRGRLPGRPFPSRNALANRGD